MANVKTGSIWHIDSTGSLETDRVTISDILLTSAAAGDTVVIRQSSSGSDILTIKNPTDESTLHIKFDKPVVIPNGLYIQTLTSNAKCMIRLV